MEGMKMGIYIDNNGVYHQAVNLEGLRKQLELAESSNRALQAKLKKVQNVSKQRIAFIGCVKTSAVALGLVVSRKGFLKRKQERLKVNDSQY